MGGYIGFRPILWFDSLFRMRGRPLIMIMSINQGRQALGKVLKKHFLERT